MYTVGKGVDVKPADSEVEYIGYPHRWQHQRQEAVTCSSLHSDTVTCPIRERKGRGWGAWKGGRRGMKNGGASVTT